MPWGYAAAAVGSYVANSSKGGGGGGSTQTVDKSPWAAAQPWLTSNLGIGQNLQGYYQQNPFNAIQQASYGNLLQGNDYVNQMTPGLLSQFSQSQGFDRNNPRARPGAIQFPAMQGYQPTAGLLGSGGAASGGGGAPMAALTGGMNVTQNPFANGAIPQAAPAPAAPAVDWRQLFNGGFDPSGGTGG